MAEFSRLAVTRKGQALIAKILAGTASDVEFTKVAAADTALTVNELEGLESLPNIVQEADISGITRINEVCVELETAFSNTELTVGYRMQALGLYANDPEEGEILYAVTVETSGNCYIPPYNGITVSGAYIQLVTTVGNADNVFLEVNPAATATFADIQRLQKQIDALKPLYIGTQEPEKGPMLWFNTGAVPKMNTVVFLELGGENDASDVAAAIDGTDHPVMNAAPSDNNTDHVTVEIKK